MSHYKPDSDKNVNLTIDGIAVTVPEGTTILEAARKVNVKIPTLCNHPNLQRRAVCRLCVVECDGRGKLVAACANNVSEGLNVVTNNARITNIRKTIVELLLANHPQECLSCIRNTNCELQSMAEIFGIRTSPFRRAAASDSGQEIAANTIVRNIAKCIKCGRCVEVCQEVQTVHAINTSYRSIEFEICTPYGQALSNGPCVFCGQCAAVCPVGAIYEHDQSAVVWEALNDSKTQVFAQIAPAAAAALERELHLPPNTVTAGKIVSALHLMGFGSVFDASYFANLTILEESAELLDRIRTSGKLPMISYCSPGFAKFVEEFYPDLMDHLSTARNPEQIFKTTIKKEYSQLENPDNLKMAFVSIIPCIAKKFALCSPCTEDSPEREVVLTARELAGMIQLAGINISTIHDEGFCTLGPCDDLFHYNHKPKNDPIGTGSTDISEVLWKVYKTYNSDAGPDGYFQGTEVKAVIANGLANARRVLDSIRRGECDVALVGIISCNINGT